MKSWLLLILLSLSTQLSANEVNVYSARQEQLIKPLLDAFSKDTGIKVNLVTGKDDALIKKLELEGQRSPADVLITADASRLARAKTAGVLQAIDSNTLQRGIPANLRDPDKTWFGLTYRVRTIFYAPERVKANELSSYEQLADPKWQQRICVRSSNSIYNQSLTASMIAAIGVEKTQQWAQGLVKNLARRPQGGDRDQIKALAAGQCDIAIANSYYYAQMLFGGDRQQQAAAQKAKIFWANQQDRGAHINISGAGVTAAAKNKHNAIKLLEYMLQDDAQRWYATVNGEYPVKPNIPASPELQQWGKFKSDAVNLSVLGKYNAQAVKIMDQAGWK